MKNKNLGLVLVGIIAVAIAGYYSYKTFLGPIGIREIKDPTFSIYLDNKEKTFEEATDWYEVKIKYPEQNAGASDFIFKQWNDFANEFQLKSIKNRKDAQEKLGLGDMPEQKYSFNAEYKLVEGGTLFGTSTLTYVFTIYNYTGGAHGSTYIAAYTIDEYGKVYSTEEILPTSKLANINEYVTSEIQKQRQARLTPEDSGLSKTEIDELLKDDTWVKEGTAPTRENYSVVWPEGNNIVISFGQYQVASYAEGMYEVKVPKKMFE
jgi:hypothetical protein